MSFLKNETESQEIKETYASIIRTLATPNHPNNLILLIFSTLEMLMQMP